MNLDDDLLVFGFENLRLSLTPQSQAVVWEMLVVSRQESNGNQNKCFSCKNLIQPL